MRSPSSSAYKVTAFAAVSGLLTAYLAVVLGNLTLSASNDYHAYFSDASQLRNGAPVRIAGVEVGKVDKVTLNDGGRGSDAIRVDFHVSADIRIPSDVRATIRFKNLIGDQFLELDNGSADGGELRPGGIIPASQTTSSLDLDTLFNGFQPLFQGLDSAQINTLSSAIIEILQGRSGSVQHLVSALADLFDTLGENDELIGSVIENLSVALDGVADRSQNLSDLVVELESLVSHLAKERRPIGRSLQRVSDLAGESAGLLERLRPPLKSDVSELGVLADTMNRNADTIQAVLNGLPAAYDGLIRTGSYGGWFAFYLCGLRLKLTGPNGKPMYTPWTYSSLERCGPL